MTSPLDPTLASDAGALNTQVDGDESYCAACGQSFGLDLDVCPKDGARLTKLKARPDALLGRVFDGRFEVRTALGQGGMGTVYRGWQITVDREIAIKVIHPKLASDRVAVKRFLREARLSSRLNQPNIVNVYDFGQTEDGILFIAMELLRGHTLGRELDGMRPLPLKRVTTIALQLCDALDAAHGQGIVHRDLKPGNIIILDEPPGRDLIKVLDFGLAKSLVTDTSSFVTNTNAILGTPLYMPPEQIEGKPSDQRADLYSFGCMLYQMVSGRPPFLGDSVNVVLAAHLGEEPAPLPIGVPPALVSTIAHLMAKDPRQRMASARMAREAIQGVVESGFSVNELSDTSPEVRRTPHPFALAMTDPAGHGPASGSGVVVTPASSIVTAGVPRRTRLWPALLALAALAGGGVAAFMIVRAKQTPTSPASPANLTVPALAADAGTAVQPDAKQPASALDAGVPE
ncbi:MAG: serine/threonine protein kinase, partial [Deltaproteobacteria bacterium]|nr:serine/threonine protein kinase [Deltaproteobacteria bacterium]MDQ3298925.1 serine/threonine protein kinase [Myxococcota bacterium]